MSLQPTWHLSAITTRVNKQELEKVIQHGSVFVYEKGRSGIGQWTDHLKCGRSQDSRGFRTYTERVFRPGCPALTRISVSINRRMDENKVGESWNLVAYYIEKNFDTLPRVSQDHLLNSVQVPPGTYFNLRNRRESGRLFARSSSLTSSSGSSKSPPASSSPPSSDLFGGRLTLPSPPPQIRTSSTVTKAQLRPALFLKNDFSSFSLTMNSLDAQRHPEQTGTLPPQQEARWQQQSSLSQSPPPPIKREPSGGFFDESPPPPIKREPSSGLTTSSEYTDYQGEDMMDVDQIGIENRGGEVMGPQTAMESGGPPGLSETSGMSDVEPQSQSRPIFFAGNGLSGGFFGSRSTRSSNPLSRRLNLLPSLLTPNPKPNSNLVRTSSGEAVCLLLRRTPQTPDLLSCRHVLLHNPKLNPLAVSSVE
ncbi:hypothetical protein BT69DRAFT_657683 [Atractiella rhizophila]|nr:hypothetical protein BT69DRAFT_657683 [Atractiella rhizophila]